MHSYRVVWLAVLSAIIAISSLAFANSAYAQQQPSQRLVENVDIIGNRRLRKDDILYYVQTRQGDVFNSAQVERDLQAILALGFFDKVQTRVTTEDGPQWRCDCLLSTSSNSQSFAIFSSTGLHSVPESDVLKTFRERRVGVSKEAILDPVKLKAAERVIKELLAEKGHPNATVNAGVETGFSNLERDNFQY
jgi:outer membrane protein insertion porin family